MGESNIIMDLCSKYKEYINNNLGNISGFKIEKEMYNLKEKYQMESMDYLYKFKDELKKIIIQRINNDAVYNINKENIPPEEDAEIRHKEQTGEIISSALFRDMIRQLYLENRLLNEKLTLHINIIETLWAHLGNGYYFDVNETDWNKLFDYAIDLFYINPYSHSIMTKDLRPLIRSTKYLERMGATYKISGGKVVFTDETHLLVHSILENKISNLGGIRTLRTLFNKELKPKYNRKLDRYLIHRNKSTMGETSNIMRVPYNYLINICGKFLNTGSNVYTVKGMDYSYNEIIRLASYYLTALDLQGHSVFEDMMVDHKNIPEYISNNIVFENIYIPTQYNPNFVLEVLDNLYRPAFKETNIKEYTFDEYLKVASVILTEYGFCSKITLKDLISRTKIKKKMLTRILSQLSEHKENINNEFKQILTACNLFDRPLVLLDKDVYFLISPYFCGYSFIKAMDGILKREKVLALNRRLGEILEIYVKKKLEEKGYEYQSGHYSVDKPETKGECDIVLETKNEIIFLEVKKRGLPDTFELGDDVDTLKSLGEGMVHAQKQILKHRAFLQKNEFMKLHEEQDILYPYTVLDLNNRHLISISLCLPEYGFLTNKPISSALLESLMFATYHAKDPEQEHKLSKLNELSEQMVSIVPDLNEEDRKDARSIFFDTLFRSLQQFLYSLKLSNNIDELVDYLTNEIHVVYGSLDFYTTLL
ncbi:MAG: hypothetical protein WCX96_03755 [Bacilli bacterium]